MKNSKYYFKLMLKLSSVLELTGVTPTMTANLILGHCLGEKYYKSYEIKEKSGKIRKIDEPCAALMAIQEKLNSYFYRFPVHSRLKAYIPTCEGAKETALTHQFEIKSKTGEKLIRPPRWMLKLDLKDFFPSIKSKTIECILKLHFLHEKEIQQKITLLADDLHIKKRVLFGQLIKLLVWITAGRGCLMQGAPTSPYLSNLAWTGSGVIDEIIAYLVSRKKDFALAIYADDISVSFLERRYPKGVLKAIVEIIDTSKCFRINPKKTKFNRLKHGAHQIVGISISMSKYHEPNIGIPRKSLNTLRGELHKAIVVLEKGIWPIVICNDVSVPMMRGKIGWVKSVYGDRKLPPSIRKLVDEFERLIMLDYQNKNLQEELEELIEKK